MIGDDPCCTTASIVKASYFPQPITSVEVQLPVGTRPRFPVPVPIKIDNMHITPVINLIYDDVAFELAGVDHPSHAAIEVLTLSEVSNLKRTVLKLNHMSVSRRPSNGIDIRTMFPSVFPNHDELSRRLCELLFPIRVPRRFRFMPEVTFGAATMRPMMDSDFTAFRQNRLPT